jgi:hypothetical protein
MEHDKQTARSSVEQPVVLSFEVAAQLTLDLRAVREWKMRNLLTEQVETGERVAQRNTALFVERFDELADGFGSIRGAVVDRLKGLHRYVSVTTGMASMDHRS